MIIYKKDPGVQYIPIVRNGREIDHVMLLGGNNEVNEEKWKMARFSVEGDIKKRRIIEKHAKVEESIEKVEGKVIKDDKVVDGEVDKKVYKITAKKFNKLSGEEALEIVAETYDLKTLKAWGKKEGKGDVRGAIADRIKEVENYEVKKKEDKDKEE